MIVQVGPYPEPIGGISIYIKRMKQYMDLLGISNEVWDISGVKKQEREVIQTRLRYVPFKFLVRKDIEIIHYNLCGIKPKIYIGIFNKIFFKNRKKIITIHGDCDDLLEENNKKLIMALNSFDCIICVKVGDAKGLKEIGVTKLIYDIPAFLFPVKDADYEIPEYILNFIKQKNFIISANASSMQFHNNIDLYGIDMCIELVTALRNQDIDIGLIFNLPCVDNEAYYKKLISKINDNRIQENFLFVHENMELWPIIERSHLFIRPTNTDGYGVSIAEAIHYNVPSIASDVCVRPKGTVMFKSRDIDDLYEKTMDVINNYAYYKDSLNDIEVQDNSERLLRIYEEILK